MEGENEGSLTERGGLGGLGVVGFRPGERKHGLESGCRGHAELSDNRSGTRHDGAGEERGW